MILIDNYVDAKKIWSEIISGIVFKERLHIYEALINYCKSPRYLEFERHEYGELDEDAIQIVKDIKAGKDTSIDVFGRTIHIWSIKELQELKEEFYLVKKTDELFGIVVGKTIPNILQAENWLETSYVRMTDKVWAHCKYNSTEELNVVLLTDGIKFNPPQADIYGDVVIAGYDFNDEYDNVVSLDIDSLISILQSISWSIFGVCTINMRTKKGWRVQCF